MILYFTGDLVDDLNSRGSFFVSFTQLRVFSSFWSILEFLFNFLPFGNPLGIFEFFFFFTKLCIV